ncbi:MAG: carcinine hydrolase/isopenicillin-N N-acyltransferase family protein [Candidatus Marinimicrobia bacterium]|nr:carcinine hydrolase/isopenicillin-N N-acyltransferase family protein [Candidatus Neomarinimicrobiota bacterium]
MKKIIIIFITLFSFALACTSAVISGSATVDGRPLLWKHRDTGSLENKMVFISDSGYDFMGIANVADPESKNIWMGMNEKGFSIMNTASYNINEGISCNVEPDQEGFFMRRALETCVNMQDFEQLLKESSGKWGIEANFGIIDAEGNAAYYETGFYEYKKYDVNDSAIAPRGYLVRTNFSVSGTGDKGEGYIRYTATNRLFETQEKLGVDFILRKATRNMDHGMLTEHIGNMKLPKNAKDRTLVAFQDYIVRYWSASVLVIQGVKPGEDPRESMLWPIMGFPLTAMVTPVFFSSGKDLPEVITTNDKTAPLMTSAAMKLKDELFPVEHDDHNNYIDIAKLINRKKSGYLQIVIEKEKDIIRRAKKVRGDPSETAIRDYYLWLDNYVSAVYDVLLPAEPVKDDQHIWDEEKICK